MSGQRVLGATMSGALAVQTIAAVAPFGGGVYLPPPRVYVAIWTLWGLLGLVAGLGARAERLAGRFSLLVLLSMAVLGPFGRKAVTFIDTVARTASLDQGGAAS
jgi:hypothetical protein